MKDSYNHFIIAIYSHLKNIINLSKIKTSRASSEKCSWDDYIKKILNICISIYVYIYEIIIIIIGISIHCNRSKDHTLRKLYMVS